MAIIAAPMRYLVAGIALIGLIQAVVWIGQPSAPPGRRVLGVFAAPLALGVLVLALASGRVAGLLF